MSHLLFCGECETIQPLQNNSLFKEEKVKKILFIAALALSFVLVFACKSQSAVTKSEQELKSVYDRFRGGIILDGAGTYTVVRGDRLSLIAQKLYNNSYNYPLIMLASSNVVLDPDKIRPGDVLTVPDLQKNLADDKARANLKGFLAEVANIEDGRGRHDTAEGMRNYADSIPN
jgi:hypothetical protein